MTLKNRNRFSERTMRKDKLLQRPLRAAARFDLRIRRSKAQRAGISNEMRPSPPHSKCWCNRIAGQTLMPHSAISARTPRPCPGGQKPTDARQDDRLIEMATFGHHKSSKNRRRLIEGNSATGICDRASFPHHDVNCVDPSARPVFADGGWDPYSCKLAHAFDCKRAES
jgi:hypothetical protein